MVFVPTTQGEKPVVHADPCPTCSGRVKTEPDPDATRSRPIRDMTYCAGCGEIFSPWTMVAFREIEAERAAR